MYGSRPRGFTLVEMLVVIGIIGLLAALLLPAVNMALRTTRNAAISLEVNQLAAAIDAYKSDKGDYPPNFRDPNAVRRHLQRCYPKIDPTYAAAFITRATTQGQTPDLFIDEGESLVFWLGMVDNNTQYPFLSYYNPSNLTVNPKKYYPFDETRLSTASADKVSSYTAKYCRDSFYIYIDSRSYDQPALPSTAASPNYDIPQFTGSSSTIDWAYAEDKTTGVRPYWSDIAATSTIPGATLFRDLKKPANATTFQIISAGQDGDFGMQAGDKDVKLFTSGTNYSAGDKDNITNFSNGRTLGDNIK